LIDAVISLIVGVVGLLLYVSFIGSANLDLVDDMTLMILNVVPTFLGIALLYGAVRLITKGNKGGL
jgi:hypothetical protein